MKFILMIGRNNYLLLCTAHRSKKLRRIFEVQSLVEISLEFENLAMIEAEKAEIEILEKYGFLNYESIREGTSFCA